LTGVWRFIRSKLIYQKSLKDIIERQRIMRKNIFILLIEIILFYFALEYIAIVSTMRVHEEGDYEKKK